MKVDHVITILGVWLATVFGAICLHEPRIYIAAVFGTFLLVIAICVEVGR